MKKTTKTILTCSLCFCFIGQLQANINNIKGTYDILQDQYKHYSEPLCQDTKFTKILNHSRSRLMRLCQ